MQFLYSNFTIPNIFELAVERFKHRAEGGFTPSGLTCFCGVQGSGKTLSAVLYLKNLMQIFPHSICVTNVTLSSEFFDMERVIPYTGVAQMHDISNGIDGVIFLLDEIQIEFNSLESKQMSTPIFELVCQQRKQRKCIIGTTQVFGRLAKPFREQFRQVILCKNYFKSIFTQRIYSAENVAYEDDIRTELTPHSTRIFIPSPQDFKLYDTYEQVRRIRKDGLIG